MGTTIVLLFIALIFFGCGFIVTGLFWVAGVFALLALLNLIFRLIT